MIRAVFAFVLGLAAAPALADVDIKEVVSPGGIKAWLVEEHSIPFMAMEIRFRGGASLDPEGKRGEINLMTGLLEEGAAEMDSRAYSAERERLAADIGFRVYDDSLSISTRFLTENRDAGVELLRKALVETRFDQDALDRVRGQVLSIIRSDAKDPNHIAGETFDRLAWGDHPYGSDKNGTPETLAPLTRDDMFAARDRVIARDRVYIGVVGDITPEELGPMLDKLLAGIPETGAPIPPKAEFKLPAGVKVVDFPTPQSVALFGQSGIPIDDPDYFAAYVLSEAIGGGNFSSRLMDEVREKRGLTYGIGTYLVNLDLGDYYAGQFASANGKIGEALDVVRQVWADVSANGLTEKELEDTKTYMTGAYPLRFDGNDTIAGIIVGMQMNGFPIDYPKTRNQKIEAVTMDDIRRVAKRLFQPEKLGFVVVGQPEGVTSTIAE